MIYKRERIYNFPPLIFTFSFSLNMKYKLIFILTLFSFSLKSNAHPEKQKWVDSIYTSLNEEQRIGQLFMVAAYSGGPKANREYIEKLLKNRQIGGLIFMQGTAEEQARLTNRYQEISPVKLMIGMDAEWGLGMRLTGVKNLPRQMSIGATGDTRLMYEVGTLVARQCKRLGVHVNFAPVVDVNNNPANPVINFRSFGESKYQVAELGTVYMKALQDNGIMACAKHFPGHGDVSVDSHHDLPVINKSKREMEELELFPFRRLISNGLKSIMIAHLSIPDLDTTLNLPATLSYPIVSELLQEDMGFKGLIFTDALDMKGVTKYFPDGETDLRAFLAGNDVLLFTQNVPLAIQKIQSVIHSGVVSEQFLEHKVRKILAAKYDAGLWEYTPVDELNVTKDLNKDTDEMLLEVARASVTLTGHPLIVIDKIVERKGKFAYVNINGGSSTVLQEKLKEQLPGLATFTVSTGSPATLLSRINTATDKSDAVIVGIHNLNFYPGKNGAYGLDSIQLAAIKGLASKDNVIFVLLGNPYLQKHFCSANATIITYEDNSFTEETAAEVLSGKRSATGRLPVTPCSGQ